MLALIPTPQILRRRAGNFGGGAFTLAETAGRRAVRLTGAAGLEQILAACAGPEGIQAALIQNHAAARAQRLNRIVPRLARAIASKGAEAYALDISPAGIAVAANGPAGAFYAGRTLVQLARHAGGETTWPCVLIHDWPLAPVRSILLDCRQWAQAGTHIRADYLESVIERMSECKLNTLVYYDEFSSVRLQSCPELAPPGAMPKSAMRKLVEFARERFVEIVPVFNCFGHWSPAMRRHHADLSEAGQGTNFCPSNPKVERFLEKVLRELCELFPAHRFSPGCDEVETIAQCPACRKLGAEASWARHVNMVCRILKKLGRQPFIWTDFFHAAPAQSSRWQALDMLDPDIELAYWFYAPGMDAPGFREIARRAPGRRLHLYSAVHTMENVLAAYDCRLANVEEYARLLDRHPALRRRTVAHTACVWNFNCSWMEQSWPGIWRHAGLAWNTRTPGRRAFLAQFDRVFLGTDADAISRAAMDLGRCNVFDNGGGFPFRFDAVSLMYDIEDLALDRLSRAEVLARIAAIIPLAARAREVLEDWEPRVARNRYFVECLRLAADRFESFARRVLLIEECRELYRRAYRLKNFNHWQFEKMRPPDRPGVVRDLERIRGNLDALRADLPPLRRRIAAAWRGSMAPPGLQQFHLVRLDAYDDDLRRLSARLEEIRRGYQSGRGLPPPDRRFIFKSEMQFEAKRFI